MNKLPTVDFKIRSQNEFETGEMCYLEGDKAWMTLSSTDLFADKRVLIFSLPGAFTPTGQFTRMMGMLVNKDHNGFGMRSWRYAVIANNMEIEQSFVEQGLNDSGTDDDPYIETNPDNIIEFLK